MFNNNFFIKKNNSLKLSTILELTNSKLSKDADLNQEIIGISTLENATSNEITFLSSDIFILNFD